MHKYSVDFFGAKGDGATDDTAAIQSAINNLCTDSGGVLWFEPGKKYVVNGNLLIPNFNEGNCPIFTIYGNSATIIRKSGSGYAISKITGNQIDAMNDVNSRITIDRLRFKSEVWNSGGVNIHSTYNSVVQHCSFTELDDAINMEFCLNSNFTLNQFVACKKHITIKDGSWPGANNVNSQCNQTEMNQNRHNCLAGQDYAVAVINCSNVDINKPIFEGQNPVCNVYFKANECTVVKQFFITKPHIENNPTDSCFRLSLNSGIYVIQDIWNQTADVLVNVTNECANYCDLLIDRIHYLSGWENIFKQNKLTKDNVRWNIVVPTANYGGLLGLDKMFIQDSNNELPFYRVLSSVIGNYITEISTDIAICKDQYINNALWFQDTQQWGRKSLSLASGVLYSTAPINQP